MKTTSSLAVAIAAGLFIGGASLTPAKAADLGGDCCADLEERVADLEATTVRKGNRKVSVTLYGMVTRAIMAWDHSTTTLGVTAVDSDTYSVGLPVWSSKIGVRGGAAIGGGWSAGFKMEWETGDTLANNVDEDNNLAGRNDDGFEAGLRGNGLNLRQEYVYLKHEVFGTIYTGHSSVSTDGITEIDLSGSNGVARSDMGLHGAAFQADGRTFGGVNGVMNNLDGNRLDAIVRYDTPSIMGMKLSATYAEDDYWDVALRYANEFGGVIRVAAGIGYSVNTDGLVSSEDTTIAGSGSIMHVPTGLFITAAAGERERTNNAGAVIATRNFWYAKGGIKQKFSSLGATTLYGEYGNYEVGIYEGTGWGLGIIQSIDAAAMNLFATYRDLDVDDVALVPGDGGTLSYMMVGASIKF